MLGDCVPVITGPICVCGLDIVVMGELSQIYCCDLEFKLGDWLWDRLHLGKLFRPSCVPDRNNSRERVATHSPIRTDLGIVLKSCHFT